MYLRAISTGYAVPEADFTASVHSVFRSALNLRLEDNHLLTLIAPGEGDLPQGIRLDAPEDFSFEAFQVGEPAVCKASILSFERSSLTVQLSGARRWKCDLPAQAGRTGSPTYLPAWEFVWKALNARQRRSKAEIIAEELIRKPPRAGVPRRAGEGMRGLVDAARQYEINPSAIDSLIGLGPGLTPAGDDLLVGYLAGLWCTVQDTGQRVQFVSDLGKTVIDLSSKTNDISRTYLYHAAQGQVSSRLADLAEAICRGEKTERLSDIGEAAMKVGHTSGMDAVTGLLIGLGAWARVEFPE